ncbi:MAG: ABC transporter permease subunit [Streptosporangiaceae bacterium]
MTTMTSAAPAVGAVPRGRAGFLGAMRSEFTKIRSVRSTYWTLLALMVASVGISAAVSWGQSGRPDRILHGGGGPGAVVGGASSHALRIAAAQAAANVHANAASFSLFGLLIGQLIIVVLGALVITSEYSTGMIRTSLATMPRRGTVFAAKGVVFGLVALVVGLVTTFLSFFVGQAILGTGNAILPGHTLSTTLGAPGVLQAVIGGGLFLAVTGLLSFGIGAILRHSAGAISAGIGLMFVLMILTNFLPGPPSGWFGQADIDKWMPFFAGSHIWQNQLIGVNPFSPWVGFAVFCSYAAVAIAGGLTVFMRRDA